MSRTAKILSVLVVALWLLMAVAPSLLAPSDPLAINPTQAFQKPGLAHFFGTDESGRDIYTRVIHGAGDSLSIGLAATDPVRRKRAIHRIAELALTSKAAAASWQDAPASTARTTRSRKSREYGFGIVVSPNQSDETRRSASL